MPQQKTYLTYLNSSLQIHSLTIITKTIHLPKYPRSSGVEMPPSMK